MFTVYLIDDDPYILESLPGDIPWQENGFEICGKSCFPTSAIEAVEALKPHVVCCDLKMPGMDGIELIAELRRRKADCEFLMLSAYSDYADTRSFFLQKGFDYLLKPPDSLEMQITLERLARKLMKKHRQAEAVVPGPSGNSKIDDIMAYIGRNFHKKITLDLLSERFDMSAGYICALFSRHYGQPLTVFLTNFRMREAVRLMEDTDRSIREIALSCGYPNQHYFTRVFKEHYGLPPGEYMNRKP